MHPKRLAAVFLFLSVSFLPQAIAFDHSEWDQVLKRYVSHGLVDYGALAQDRQALDHYCERIQNLSFDDLSEWNREERMAFWINVFNAAIVRLILDSYPLERFDQIPAAFGIRIIRVGGEFFSLSELRDEVLRKTFREERVLTALVSGTMDSPKLFTEAFQGDRLEEQLNRAAHEFVGDESHNRIVSGQKEVFLSPVFEHYGSDFVLNFGSDTESSRFSKTESAVISLFLHHLRDPEKRLFLNSGKFRIHYLPADPRLNDTRFAERS